MLNYLRYIFLFALALLLNSSNARAQDYNKDAVIARVVLDKNLKRKFMEDGYEAGILFVIQMKGIRYLEPNDRTHPAFGEALRRAEKAGVQVLAVDCQVTPESISADQMVEVRL